MNDVSVGHGRADTTILEVIDDDITRTLYFGSRAKQSSMLLAHPTVLVLTYTQAMLAALLFQPAPRSALVIGLGGGSLPKFLFHHFPDCQVRAVTICPSRTASGFSHVPPTDSTSSRQFS